MAEQKKSCFIIMPITTPDDWVSKYNGGAEHFTHVLECLFVPAVKLAGFETVLPKAKGADLIHAGIVRNLETSDLVLCDMSTLNPNVFFEFGIRTALNKPVCVVKDELTSRVPFDAAVLNYGEYSSKLAAWEAEAEVKKLAEHVTESATRNVGVNAMWKYFGLSAPAKPFEVKGGAEERLEYLTTLVEALNRRQGSSLDGSQFQWTNAKSSAINRLLGEILPSTANFVMLGYGEEPVAKVGYEGRLDDQSMREIAARVVRDFGVALIFEKMGDKRSSPLNY
jgi:hypothetical protein